MALINFANREIVAKVVYYGASGAGCTTNLRQLHARLEGSGRSQLHRFGPADSEERTLSFEHRGDPDPDLNGLAVCFRLYSLPSSIRLAAHRDEVMREVDAVVFVADARPGRNADNMDSLLDLERLLGAHGLDLASAPVVIQVNHLDHEESRPLSDVTFDLNPFGFPVTPASARGGEGVLETFRAIAEATTAKIKEALAGRSSSLRVWATHDPEDPSVSGVIRRHVDAIQASHAAEIDAEPEGFGRPAAVDSVPPRSSTARARESSPTRAATHRESTSARSAPRESWAVDGEGHAVEVPFQPRELVGSRPIELVGGSIVDGEVHIELLMQRMGTEETRRLTVVMVNRPPDSVPAARVSPPSVIPEGEDRVRDYLPDTVDITSPDSGFDLPPVLYGVIGVGGGVLIGLMAGYLLGVIV